MCPRHVWTSRFAPLARCGPSQMTSLESGNRSHGSRLKALDPAMVVLESTGGLELPSVAALAAAALPVAIVNPRQVRDFARATGTLAKTDAPDAVALAHFADAVRPVVRPLKDVETQVLSSPVARRHQVVSIVVAEEQAWKRDRRRPPPDRGPHRLAGTGAERRRRRAAADIAQQSGVAGEGRHPAQRPRGGRAALPRSAIPVAGVGHAESLSSRRSGGRGSLQPRQRHCAR